MAYRPLKNIGGRLIGKLYGNIGIATYWNRWRIGISVMYNRYDSDMSEFLFGSKYKVVDIEFYLLPFIVNINFNWFITGKEG